MGSNLFFIKKPIKLSKIFSPSKVKRDFKINDIKSLKFAKKMI